MHPALFCYGDPGSAQISRYLFLGNGGVLSGSERVFHQTSNKTAIILTKEGIGAYITMWLKTGSELDAIDRELGAGTLRVIPDKSSGGV